MRWNEDDLQRQRAACSSLTVLEHIVDTALQLLLHTLEVAGVNDTWSAADLGIAKSSTANTAHPIAAQANVIAVNFLIENPFVVRSSFIARSTSLAQA